MAHFAKLDENNIVTEVLVVNNEVLLETDGTESEYKGMMFLNGLFGSATWVQTSYNNNFKKQYAGIGYTYDETNDVFIALQPFNSWSLDRQTSIGNRRQDVASSFIIFHTDGQRCLTYGWGTKRNRPTWDLITE